MASFQFACPYCSGEFEVRERPAGEAIACPHCGKAVSLPSERSAEADESAPVPPIEPGDDEDVVAAGNESTTSPSALDFLEQPTPGPTTKPSRRPLPRRPPSNVRRLSREEQERRRMIRNAVLMTIGMIVLAVAVTVLSRM